MAILSTTDITESTRRNNIRELAGITPAAYSDIELDAKIENADAIALALFNTTTIPADNARNFLTIANINAAILLLLGLPENDAQPDRIRELRMTAERIQKAINQTAPAQNSVYFVERDAIAAGQGDII